MYPSPTSLCTNHRAEVLKVFRFEEKVYEKNNFVKSCRKPLILLMY